MYKYELSTNDAIQTSCHSKRLHLKVPSSLSCAFLMRSVTVYSHLNSGFRGSRTVNAPSKLVQTIVSVFVIYYVKISATVLLRSNVFQLRIHQKTLNSLGTLQCLIPWLDMGWPMRMVEEKEGKREKRGQRREWEMSGRNGREQGGTKMTRGRKENKKKSPQFTPLQSEILESRCILLKVHI